MKKSLRLLIIGLIISLFSCTQDELELTPSQNSINSELKLSSINQNTSESSIKSLQSTLKILWNTNVGGNDYMTSTSPTEAISIGIKGQTYYISKDYIDSENQTVYRAYNGQNHITSVSTLGEGNYTTEGILGYAWLPIHAPTGTSPMYRVYNSSNGDHSLANGNYTIQNYNTKEYLNTYGYPRYNINEKLLTLTGNSLTVKSNLVAGGSVWELWWNGKQFVNVHDYGRQIQSSLNLGYGALPTEAGDQWHNSNFHLMHGSPIIEAKNIGKTQITNTIPLEWNNTNFNNTGNKHDLVIYKDFKLGKELKLDGDLNLGDYNYLKHQIIQYKTTFYTPVDLPNVDIEIPTGYLNSEFNRFFEIDATKDDLNNGLNEVTNNLEIVKDDKGNDIGLAKQFGENKIGGVVIATDNLNYTMGVYLNSSKQKDDDFDSKSIYYTKNWKFGDAPKWSLARKGTIPSGNNEFNSYIIVGTLDEVRLAMRLLYVNSY